MKRKKRLRCGAFYFLQPLFHYTDVTAWTGGRSWPGACVQRGGQSRAGVSRAGVSRAGVSRARGNSDPRISSVCVCVCLGGRFVEGGI